MSKFGNFLSSFFWGNWFMRLVQTLLIIIVIGSLLLALFCFETVMQGEMGILAAAPLVLFVIGAAINTAILFGLRKVKDSKNASTRALVITLAVISCIVAVIPSAYFVVLFATSILKL